MTNSQQTALLIIDVQNGMFAFPETQPHNGKALIKTINGLIKKARAAQCPVIFVQHDGVGEHPLVPGSKGHDILDALDREEEDPVIRKTQCGSFNDTALLETLQNLNIGHLIVCGMQTEFCVDTAIRSASDNGFKITIAEQGHSTFNSDTLKASDIIAHHQTIWATAFGTVKPALDIEFARYQDV